MENQKRYDLILSGVGSSSGGSFNNVVINGTGKISGDVDCIDFSINGVGSVAGCVKTKSGKINGKGRIEGDFQADEFKANGTSDFGGRVEVKEAKFEGMVCIGGSVAAETLENRGVITVKEDCNSEVFISKGVFTIGGLLNAGNIDISMYASCRAREIGGERITVNKGHSFSLIGIIKSIFPSLPISIGLFAETIEGDDIYLEHTKAKVVRGNNVTLGEGCEVELVEYTGSFRNSGNAVVTENKKIG